MFLSLRSVIWVVGVCGWVGWSDMMISKDFCRGG